MIKDRPDTPNPSLNKRQRSLQERISKQFYAMSKEASLQADTEKSNRIMGRSLSGKPIHKPRTRVIRLFCELDEGELVKVKGLKLEFSPDVVKPRYRCNVCFSFYSGWRPDELKLESNPDVSAIYTTWGD